MSLTAHHLKTNEYFYDEHDKTVYHVLKKEDCHKDGHKVKLQVEVFATGKHTNRSYSHDHHLIKVEPHTINYTLSHVTENETGGLQLGLFDSNMTPRDDLMLTDESLILQTLKVCEEKKDDLSSVNVRVLSIEVPAMHRTDEDVAMERIVFITGVDFSHLYDHHHGHHHH